jgi:hypothetical protein
VPEWNLPHLSHIDQQSKVSATEARRRKECALASLREIQLAEIEGRLLRADQVEQLWSAAIVKIRTAVLAIPSRCALKFSNPREAEQIIRAECEAALRTLAKHDRGR